MSRAERRRAEREARKQQRYAISHFNEGNAVCYKTFECNYTLTLEALDYCLNHFTGQGMRMPEAIASAVFNLCGAAVENDEETRTAFISGRDINFNLGKGVVGNIINTTYSPKRKRIEELLFDAGTFAKLGVRMDDLAAAANIIASTSCHHQEAFASITN